MGASNGKEAPVESSDSVAVPSELLNINASAFLLKTYDMVDDPANHRLVSWSPMNNSFIVKDEQEFAKVLLPKYFKHNNFASFRRQLNNYGFKRLDRWEFKNEGFIRGKRHLLSSIVIREPAHEQNQQPQQTHGLSSRVDKYAEFDKFVRREPAHGQNQQPQQTHVQSSRVDMYAEFDKYVIEEEIKRLKRDNNMLMQGVVKSRKQQQTTDAQLEAMMQRIDVMNQKHQEMRSILFKDVNVPDFSAECAEGRNESSMLTTEGNKKRRLEPDVVPEDHPVTPDGHILSPDLDFIEILKSVDFSGGEFPVSSPLGIDVEEMDSTPPAAQQHISDVVPDDHPVTLDGQILSPDLDFIWDSSFDEILKIN
ncbi:hypothetical protein POM88_017655 [Heracleum sosnowskyi]|uniref:HSF-type DNA-binding domain-containing protein n=1 Tax=Heracleum sosnowskyi TaxID=360622 RepID=A0AAD8MYH9_9APIA|nr:hypothetical protein POM88_017655 [Heracleum sosnowskyi]